MNYASMVGASARRQRYRALRQEMIAYFAKHYLAPESVDEASEMANEMNRFAAEMDALASDFLRERDGAL